MWYPTTYFEFFYEILQSSLDFNRENRPHIRPLPSSLPLIQSPPRPEEAPDYPQTPPSPPTPEPTPSPPLPELESGHIEHEQVTPPITSPSPPPPPPPPDTYINHSNTPPGNNTQTLTDSPPDTLSDTLSPPSHSSSPSTYSLQLLTRSPTPSPPCSHHDLRYPNPNPNE